MNSDRDDAFASVNKAQEARSMSMVSAVDSLLEVLARMVRRSEFKTDRIDEYREETRELNDHARFQTDRIDEYREEVRQLRRQNRYLNMQLESEMRASSAIATLQRLDEDQPFHNIEAQHARRSRHWQW